MSIAHFTVQRDHLHLIVERDDEVALSRGIEGHMKGVRTLAAHGSA